MLIQLIVIEMLIQLITLRKKLKMKNPKLRTFHGPAPLLPSRLQLSPLASTLLAPRDQPFTDAEVGSLEKYIHQKRHALNPLGGGTWSTSAKF